MAPKTKKDVPLVQQEDYSQDIVLLTTVTAIHLKLGLLAAADTIAPEPLSDATVVPPLYIELLNNDTGPVASTPAVPTSTFQLPINLEHKFRHKKGHDVINRIINSSLEVRLCSSQSNSAIASAVVDLLPFGLGASEISNGSLPLVQITTEDVLKVLPGSCLSLSVRSMHQPGGCLQQDPGVNAPASSAPACSAKVHATEQKTEAGSAGAAGASLLEPLTLVDEQEALGCNVLEMIPKAAQPLSPQLLAAAHAAGGALTCTLALHLPNNGAAQQVLCAGARIEGNQLGWRKGCRAFLACSAVQALKARMELDQPLLLEVARYLNPQSGSTECLLSDPAFSAYHAVLSLDCAAEQLQEPGATTCTGAAVPLGSVASALQQGKLATAVLPLQTLPLGGRVKAIEEAPQAGPDGQQPACAWQAAGTQFMVELRLARPLYPPWQPPERPKKRLTDFITPKQRPPQAQAPSAASSFRAKVQMVAQELAEMFTAAGSKQDSAPGSREGLDLQKHLSVIFELNHSGKYLAIIEQLKQVLLELVQDRYKTAGNKATLAEAQQLHNDFYVYVMEELQQALLLLTAEPAASSSASMAEQLSVQPKQQSTVTSSRLLRVSKLLQLAAECEYSEEFQRSHALHQQRLVLLPTAEAWYDYGAFCMRTNECTRAEAAFRQALSIQQQHCPAMAALICLGLSIAEGHKDCSGPDTQALEWAEVLGHLLKDTCSAYSALPWALLALLYRLQGKPKEAHARSCHQEVIRQAKAVLTAQNGAIDNATDTPSQPVTHEHTAMVAANGYLAAAELCLQLCLPALGSQLLDLAAGIKDPAGVLLKRTRFAAIAASQQSGDRGKAMQLLRDLSQQVAKQEEDMMLIQLQMGDIQFKDGNLNLAKQHYRRAVQKTPQLCSPRVYLQLASCFMRSGDVAIAIDTLQSCLSTSASDPYHPVWLAPFAPLPVGMTSRCAPVWLGLGVAHLRLSDHRECELALSEANLCDPEHPSVWGYLALLYLQQGRDADAQAALNQAQRHGLREPQLLMDIADQYHAAGRFCQAERLMKRTIVTGLDSVKVRCKLAAVLLAQHDYEGCQEQLAAAAQQEASEDDKAMLLSVLQKLHVTWPHL